jgi:hypothetical protein
MLPENSLRNGTVGPSPESILRMFVYSDPLSLRSKVLLNLCSLFEYQRQMGARSVEQIKCGKLPSAIMRQTIYSVPILFP